MYFAKLSHGACEGRGERQKALGALDSFLPLHDVPLVPEHFMPSSQCFDICWQNKYARPARVPSSLGQRPPDDTGHKHKYRPKTRLSTPRPGASSRQTMTSDCNRAQKTCLPCPSECLGLCHRRSKVSRYRGCPRSTAWNCAN